MSPRTSFPCRAPAGGWSVGLVQQPGPALTDAQAERLAALGVRVEALDAGPVDIEWCRTGDDLWLVQARPITTAGERDPWNDSRSGDFLWTNTNVGEAIPDVMTPATWSMVQVFLSDAMATASVPPYLGYGRIGGRIYLNVSVMKSLSGAAGVNERRFRTLTAEVFGQLPEDLEIPPVPAGRLAILRAIGPMAVHVIGEARRDAKVLDAYLAAHPDLCDRRRAEIATVDDPWDLADLWTGALDPEFNRVSWMLSAATRSSGASFVTTRMRLQQLVGDAGANALTSGLGGGQAGQLASLGLLDGLDQLARGEIDRDDLQPALRAPRAARVRDLAAATGRGPGLDRHPARPAGRVHRTGVRRPAGRAAPPPAGGLVRGWNAGTPGRPRSCTASWRCGPGSPGTGSGPAAR